LPSRPHWREYQDKVAVFLSQMGFDVAVDEAIQGARAGHKIDVTARTSIAGLDQCWLIECKSWKRRVPKDRVLTFRGIVEDIGADRGLLFSESGFQAGAIYTARNTNVTLTSLAEFEHNFPSEVSFARARVLDERVVKLMRAFAAVWDLPESERAEVFAQYSGPPRFPGLLEGTPHAVVGVTARMSQMRRALEDARFNRWPVAYYPLDHTDGELFDVSDWEGLLFIVERTLLACEQIYARMTAAGASRVDWRDLQPSDLVELLDAIRNANS
jgi:Restriction endonuclease